MTFTVSQPYRYFVDLDGTALESGKIYVGESGLDAELNPITIYWDAAATIVATQPIRTIGGVPDNNGTPSNFYTSTDFSITVNDSNDVLVYSKLSSNPLTADQVSIVDAGGFYTGTDVEAALQELGTSGGSTYNEGGTGAVDRTVENRLQESLYLSDYGLSGDSDGAGAGTDDTVKMQAAIDAIVARGGGTVIGDQNKRYLIDSNISLLSGNVRFQDVNWDISNQTGEAVSISGTADSALSLTSDANKGATLVNLNSHGWSGGDWIMLSSGTAYVNDGNSTPATEIMQILSVPDINNVELASQLQHNYTTAATATAQKINFIEDIHFEGGSVTGGLANTATDFCVFSYVKGITVTGFKSKDVVDRTFGLKYTKGSSFYNVSGSINLNATAGGRYFIVCGRGSEDIFVSGGRGHGFRHFVTSGGEAATTRNVTEIGGIYLDAMSGLDIHPSTINYTAIGNKLVMSNRASTSEDGATLQGFGNIVFIGNVIIDAKRNGILTQALVNDFLGLDANYMITGNVVTNPGSIGVSFSVIDDATGVGNITIDNSVSGAAKQALYLNFDSTGPATDSVDSWQTLDVRGTYQSDSTAVNCIDMDMSNSKAMIAGEWKFDVFSTAGVGSTAPNLQLNFASDAGAGTILGGVIKGQFKNGTSGIRTINHDGKVLYSVITKDVTTPVNLSGADNIDGGSVDI